MTERRPPHRATAERRHETPATGTLPASGEFRIGAASHKTPPSSRGGAGPRRFQSMEMVAVRPEPTSDSTQLIGRMLDDELAFDLDYELGPGADDGLELDGLPSSHRPRLEQPRSSTFEPSSAAWPIADDPPPSRSGGSRSGDDAPPSSRGAAPPSSRNGGAPPSSRNGGAPPSSRNGGPPPSRGGGPPPSRGAPVSRTSTRGMPAVGAPPPSGRTASHPALDTHASILAFAGYGTPPTSVLRMPLYALRVIKRRRVLRADLARARLRSSPDVGLYEAALRATDDGAVRTGLLVAGMMWTLSLLLAATVYQVMSSGLPFLK